jgi:calcium-dependent protein kinase
MIDLIMRGEYDFEKVPTWATVSDLAKEFVSKLLVIDPDDRMDAEYALNHQWIVNLEQMPDELPSPDVFAEIEDSLSNYRHFSELKKLALTVIAHRSTQSEIVDLRKVFERYDTGHDVSLDRTTFVSTSVDLTYPPFISAGYAVNARVSGCPQKLILFEENVGRDF